MCSKVQCCCYICKIIHQACWVPSHSFCYHQYVNLNARWPCPKKVTASDKALILAMDFPILFIQYKVACTTFSTNARFNANIFICPTEQVCKKSTQVNFYLPLYTLVFISRYQITTKNEVSCHVESMAATSVKGPSQFSKVMSLKFSFYQFKTQKFCLNDNNEEEQEVF